MLRLTVWMNMPTFYQADLFRALIDTGKVDLQVVFAHGITAERRELGWSDDVQGFSSTFLRRRWGLLDAIGLAWRQRDRIHIVNGLWAEPSFIAALAVLALQGSSYVIYSEAPDPAIGRSPLKRLIRTTLGRAFSARARGWLPISRFAVEFYKSLGARRENMYPFGYFRSRPMTRSAPPLTNNRPTRITAVFVGQVIERKGLDLLLAALGSAGPGVTLQIIGDGIMRPECERQAHSLGIDDRVVFEGVLPAETIPERIARADVLVLPSRWDGWGLVVNEALAAGVPVIVSDRCGAAEVVRHGVTGYVFQSGQVEGLRQCICEFAEDRDAWSDRRAACQAIGDALATETVAPYLIECLNHVAGLRIGHPVAPWIAALSPLTSHESA